MRIAVASKGRREDSEICVQAARAPYFLIFENGELVEVVENTYREERGRGWRIGELLSQKGVEKFIAGNIGENLKRYLEERGIEYERKEGKVKDVI